jgi:hypothetical protein
LSFDVPIIRPSFIRYTQLPDKTPERAPWLLQPNTLLQQRPRFGAVPAQAGGVTGGFVCCNLWLGNTAPHICFFLAPSTT